MRAIKFRAFFNGHTPKMCYEIGDGSEETKGVNATILDYQNDKNWIIEQFTGLLDKNGKEIYEGDIVRFSTEYEDCCQSQETEDGKHGEDCKDPECVGFVGEDEPETDVVRFEDGGFIINASTGEYDMTTLGWAMNDCFVIEVIGNIHENPELLTTP